MKKILRYWIIFVFALISTNQLLGNLNFHTPIIIIQVGLVISLFEIILKPIIKILLLPINLLTLGLFRIIIDTLGLYLADFLIFNFTVTNINLPSSTIAGIIFPAIQLNGFVAYLCTSFILTSIFYIFKSILIRKAKI